MASIATWPRYPLGELCDIQIGRTPPRANSRYWGTGYPWLSIADMDQGRELFLTKEQITQAALGECGSRLLAVGTLVMSFKLSVGKLGFVRTPMATNEAIAALLVRDPNTIDSNFLYHALQASDLLSKTDRAVMGVTLNKAKLEQIVINVPPINEQRRIAAILEKADAIRKKRREALKVANEFLSATFLDMFGNPVRNEKGWTQSSLGAIAPERGEIVDGPFGSSLKPDQYVDDGVRVIRNFNVRPGYFDASAYKYVTPRKFEEIRRSEVCTGDLLISTKGTVGNVCLMPALEGPSVLSATGTVRIRISAPDVEPVFVMHQMLMPQYQRYIEENQSGAVQQYLNLSGIRDLAIILPPHDLQLKFVETARRVDKLTQKAQTSLREADHLFSSLAQRAFNGGLQGQQQ